jgi:hypothetical protein
MPAPSSAAISTPISRRSQPSMLAGPKSSTALW